MVDPEQMDSTRAPRRGAELLAHLAERHPDRLLAQHTRAASPGVTAPWPAWLHPGVKAAYEARGVVRPWAHQSAMAEALHAGQHTVISTSTASGKTMAFSLAALDAVSRARRPNGRPGASVLYLSPTKALAADQLSAVATLSVGRLAATTHDGDATREQRDWARDHAEWVLSNPDMLHHSLLPEHGRWSRFFSQLRFVIIDECHHYRGVFGAHVALVLRRLRRVCAHYGADPTFALASATIANPALTASRLTGLEAVAITDDGSRRGALTLGFWQPPLLASTGENGAPQRRAADLETADLLAEMVIDDVATLAFTRSRRGAETTALKAAQTAETFEAGLGSTIAPYRGGFLPEERRAVEEQLRSGALRGVAATNALELGIDISGLDAVILSGYPGTRAAVWQQAGRAGRGAEDALAIFVARGDPLDNYLVHNPKALTEASVEAVVFDPGNPYVIGPHLCAAAHELPLSPDELPQFGKWAEAGADALTEAGLLRRRAAGWFYDGKGRPGDLADLRGGGGRPITLLESATGRVIGLVDSARAHQSAHSGAVYLHQGRTWLVEQLDLDDYVALMTQTEVGYSTHARETTDIRVLRTIISDENSLRPSTLHFGTVEVSAQVVSYLKRRNPGGQVVGVTPLDLPRRLLETTSVWWTMPDAVWQSAGLNAAELPGAAHAAEHAAIGILPLLATCDRWDIGGVSTALHPDTGLLTVFVYDGHPGGAGFSERGFEVARAWLDATRSAIAACPCLEGCPSCVQSPKCGNGNHPLDKAGALRLLGAVLGSPGP